MEVVFQSRETPLPSAAGFTNRFRAALIFLGVILFIAIILVLLYLILKRDMCNCFGDKKKSDEEEDVQKEDEDVEEQAIDDELEALEEQRDRLSPELQEENNEKVVEHDQVVVPVVTITDEDSKGVTTKRSKRSALKSVLKKIARPLNKVRFGGVTESERSPLVENQSQAVTYDAPGSLGAMHHSGSMESLVSGVSAVSSANVEEYGDEVSPGRVQVTIEYVKRNWALHIGVMQVDGIVCKSNEKFYWQIHVALLPFKRHRFKTKYKSSSTPVFNQTYEVDDIAAQALSQLSVRFRLYGKAGAAGRKKVAGEAELHLSSFNEGEGKSIEWLVLKKKSERVNKMESLV